MRLGALALLVVCCACTSACSAGTDDAAAPASTTLPGAAVPDPACAPFRGTEGPLTSSGERPEALLVDAFVEQVGCLDRVTFEFESLGDGTPPRYTVGYRDLEQDPLLDAGGQPVAWPASTALVVAMSPARSTDPRVEDQPPTYSGNLRLAYGATHHIQIVQKLDDADGAVRWAIGLDTVRPFIVDSAVGPTRVNVYIG
jgi:hypothetical protein